jgi:hypothetical protein
MRPTAISEAPLLPEAHEDHAGEDDQEAEQLENGHLFGTGQGSIQLGRRGVLTKVSSTDPEVGLFAGDDAWFRVLDSPDGDRSTSMGFVGVIESSEAYCAMQIWPDGNARTHPVTEGQIKVATG